MTMPTADAVTDLIIADINAISSVGTEPTTKRAAIHAIVAQIRTMVAAATVTGTGVGVQAGAGTTAVTGTIA